MNNIVKKTAIPEATKVALWFNYVLMRGQERSILLRLSNGEVCFDIEALERLLKDRDTIKIGVHDGAFHADEVVAICLIELIFDVKAEVVRSRDPEVLNACDLVFDVLEGTFDHHRSRCDNISCAASRVLRALHNTEEVRSSFGQFVWKKLANLINAVAYQDNGGAVFERLGYIQTLARRARITGEEDKYFMEALDKAEDDIRTMMENWVDESPAYDAALEVIKERPHANVLVFGTDCLATDPKKIMWDEAHPALYWISPASPEKSKWNLMCCAVPREGEEDEYDGFSSRFLLPVAWRGVDGEELDKLIGTSSAIFCHKQGFMAAFASLEDAEKAAQEAIKALTGED